MTVRLFFRATPIRLSAAASTVHAQATATRAAPARPAALSNVVHYVKVNGADYNFTVQESVPAGIVAFNLVNAGSDLHAMAVFELPKEHTLREFLDQYHAQGMVPVWMSGLGQTPTIAPNAEAFLTVRMKPGRYILACLIPARDGRMHTEKGMVKLITVK
ncbi:MAG: hypothetical protein IT353_08900 [Gemmatimonadaceae bacterium]|nr:hypothetical protein [Gemmatimonadaceae bacterium]